MKKLIRYTFLVLLALGLDGCKKLTENAAVDPVNITDPSVIATTKFLSGAQVGLIASYEGDIARLAGMWDNHFSGEDRQYVPQANYVISARDFNTAWANIYSTLAQCNIINQRNQAQPNPRVQGITQVMQAMLFGLAADLWGDVPYTEALQFPTITQPKYDRQADVYAAVQSLLDQAIVNLQQDVPSALDPGTADVFFTSDPAKWTRVANTLKARYFLHTKDYASALQYSDPAIAIDTTANNMLAPHGNNYLQNFNLYYSFLSYDRSGYMGGNALAPRLLDPAESTSRNNAKTNEEARLWYYYLPGGGANISGIPYDLNVNTSEDGWGNPTPASNGFFASTTSFPLVTYEENMLIRAEAFAKQGNTTEALATLNRLRATYSGGSEVKPGYLDTEFSSFWGIVDAQEQVRRLGFLYAPYTIEDFNPGGIDNKANLPVAEALLREIVEERYITLTGQLETFNDMRRTKNLLGLPIKNGGSQYPERFLYPQSELNANAANVPQANLFTPTPVNSSPY